MATELSTVEDAIDTIMAGGQAVTVDGMEYTAANISALIALRHKLKKETDRATRPTFRAVNLDTMGY